MFNHSKVTKRKKETLKSMFPIGSRVKIISLVNEEPNLPDGTTGTVIGYDDQPALLVRWDNGSSLSLLPFEGDCFEKVN